MGQYAAKLNAGGSAPQPLGPLTQLTVQRGDTLRVSVSGLYPQQAPSSRFAFSLASFVASLLQPAPASPPTRADGSRHGGLPLLQVGLNAAALTAIPQLANRVPKGYLRVLVFTQDSVLVDQRQFQLSQAAQGHYELLGDTLTVRRDGYVTVYVGNESPVDVYFDELSVEHRPGLLVQETQYDPAGLELAGLAAPSPGIRGLNNYRFNGKEFQTDLGLSWNHQDWRFFDSQLLRWHSVDPEIEDEQESWTPYSFGFDNAVRYADADGRFPIAAILIGAAVGAGVEYSVQVATNLIESHGEVSSQTFTGGNVNGTKILLAGAAGGVGALTGAVFGQAATGLTKIASVSRLANSSRTATKVLSATIKLGGELSGDVVSSVAGNKIQGKEVTLAGTITDVAGGVVSRRVQLARQMTPDGQVLRRAAGRTANIAARRGRANAIGAATDAADKLARKGAVSSGLASGATTNAISTGVALKEKYDKQHSAK